ncbi:hypothetical protein FHS55_002137 [Angulomicrobium tetraedrale]|uniref:Uncharacterized protein n=1 Tax=Ancylobacter tetraedralis TaxID=217068 RepID=A0A839Z9Z5_9HYPH|nr:hypothetical protein [Ancylobacter tetraedralis]MBB3771538.1 hypothetical protein [Ancylobacter tetraedralis]
MAQPVDSGGPRIMWAISQIVERDGISKQAVSKVVQSLIEKHDIPVERDGRGRVAKVSLAHYDFHRGQFVNPAKVAAARGASAPPAEPGTGRNDSFDEARRINEWLKVEQTRLQQRVDSGKLLRADKIGEALDHVGREAQAIIARLPNKADDIALAGAKEGVHGVRVLLRTLAAEINTQIADALAKIGVEAPATDAALTDDGG